MVSSSASFYARQVVIYCVSGFRWKNWKDAEAARREILDGVKRFRRGGRTSACHTSIRAGKRMAVEALLPTEVGPGGIPVARGVRAGPWIFASGITGHAMPDNPRPLSGLPRWSSEAASMYTGALAALRAGRHGLRGGGPDRPVFPGLARGVFPSPGAPRSLRQCHRSEHVGLVCPAFRVARAWR